MKVQIRVVATFGNYLYGEDSVDREVVIETPRHVELPWANICAGMVEDAIGELVAMEVEQEAQ